MEKHKHFNPDCPFVVNPSSSGNIPINMKPSITVDTNNLSSSELFDEQKRLQTFDKWPVILTILIDCIKVNFNN